MVHRCPLIYAHELALASPLSSPYRLKASALSYSLCNNGYHPSRSHTLTMLRLQLIVVDDLRLEMAEAYNMKHMLTPNFDAFAKTAVTFTHAMAQCTVCAPSR